MTAARASTREWPAGARATPDVDLTGRLRASIGRLARRLNAATDSSIGLTPTQASVLGVVVRHGRLGLAELAEIESINPTMLSRIVGRLGDASLVERSADETNRRAGLLTATTAGRDLHERIRDERTAALTAALRRLPAAEVEAILSSVVALESLARELAIVNNERSTQL